MHLFLFIDQTFVQTPSQFCSSERTPNPSHEELARLPAMDLGAPTSANMDVNNTIEDHEITSETDLCIYSSTEVDVNYSPECLGMTSQIFPNTSSFNGYD